MGGNEVHSSSMAIKERERRNLKMRKRRKEDDKNERREKERGMDRGRRQAIRMVCELVW